MTRGTHLLMTRGTRFYPDFPTRTCGALLLSGLSSGRGTRHSRTLHLDDHHIASGRPTYPIRICLSGSLTEVSKSCTSFQQPATTHVPPLAEWKDRNEVTASHFPRSLSAARRVMMTLPPPRGIMTKPKYLPTIKEGNKASDTIYMDLHTRRKRNLPYLVKSQLLYLSNHGWQNYRRVCSDTFYRDDWTRTLSWLKACVHLAVMWIIGTQGLNKLHIYLYYYYY